MSCIEKIEDRRYEISASNEGVKLSYVVALLPVSLPVAGNTLGWLGWYIIVSIPLVVMMRKLMKIYV